VAIYTRSSAKAVHACFKSFSHTNTEKNPTLNRKVLRVIQVVLIRRNAIYAKSDLRVKAFFVVLDDFDKEFAMPEDWTSDDQRVRQRRATYV